MSQLSVSADHVATLIHFKEPDKQVKLLFLSKS